LPKEEDQIGRPLSPYAVTKRVNELYAKTFQEHYGLETIGLRYFNVFGPRQNPEGPYAAVIPRWITDALDGKRLTIYGDGATSRDFCYVANAVQANLRAASAPVEATGQVYNIAVGERTTLNELHELITGKLQKRTNRSVPDDPLYDSARPGDIRHSEADITAASEQLGYSPTHTVTEGIENTLDWYVENWSCDPL
jgi:UDP-N-acetylglucosamine 4-epimerase